MRSFTALLAVWIVLSARSAAAGDGLNEKRLLQAMVYYDIAKFTLAKDILVLLVDAPGLSDTDRMLARIFLGASYYYLKDKASARAQLIALHRQFPGVTLDTGYFSPDITELSEDSYADVLRENPSAARPRRDLVAVVPSPPGPPPRTPVPPPVTPPPAPAPAARPPPVKAPAGPGLLALVPFGVGQFARGEAGKGHLFLWSELAALGAGFGGFAYFQSLKRAPSEPWVLGTAYVEDVSHARAVQTFYVSFGVLAAAIALYGVFDAATPPATAQASAVIGGDGAGLAVRF